MQKIIMELKLLTVAVRRAETPVAQRYADAADAALRGEMRQLEARLTARLDAYERTMAEIQGVAIEHLEAVRGQIAALEAGMAAAQERANRAEASAVAMEERMTARFIEGLETAGGRIAKVERDMETVRTGAAKFEKDIALDLHALEAAMGAQEASVQSARTAIAQTDDLVERVVEALESLQSAVLEQSEEDVSAVDQPVSRSTRSDRYGQSGAAGYLTAPEDQPHSKAPASPGPQPLDPLSGHGVPAEAGKRILHSPGNCRKMVPTRREGAL